MDYRKAWIPIEDSRKPKDGDDCIVTYVDEYGDKYITFVTWTDDIGGKTLEYTPKKRGGFYFYSWKPKGNPWKEQTGVTAWMPSPEAYG